MAPRRTRDTTFVLRVWLEPDDDEPRARLLTTDEDEERTAVGAPAIIRLVESALVAFVGRAG